MAQKVVIDIDVKSNKGVENVNDLNNSLDKTNKKQKELKKSTNDTSKALDKSKQSSQRNAAAFEAVNKATGGAIRGVRSLIKQLWLLVANPIGAVIAAIVLGLTALYKAFTSTKAGGEKFDQLMAGIGATIDVLRDRVLKVGTAILKFFSGDFKGALKAGKEAVSGFGEEVSREFKQAAEATKNLQEVTDAARKLSVSRAELNRDLIKAKEIIEGGTASYNEKKKAIEEVRKAETKQTEEELKNAQKKLDAIVLANSLSDSGAEDLEKEAQARIAVANLEAESSRNKTKFNKLEKLAQTEELARLKAISDEKKKADDEAAAKIKKSEDEKKKAEEKAIADENKRLEAIQKVRDDFKQKQKEKEAETELEKIDLEEQKKIDELDKLNATEKQKQEVYEYYAGLRTDVEVKENKKKEQIEKLRKQQTLSDAKGTFNQIAMLAGKDSKIGKAMALASATISGVEGVQNAYSTAQKSPITALFPGYPIVQAGLAGAVALKNISAIKSVKESGGGGTMPSPPSTPSTPSIPPAFNVVGASDTNQLATAIGGQSQQPIQAFVVSNDVTTAQEMDRNIIDGASIG